MSEFSDLLGKTLVNITKQDGGEGDEIIFEAHNGQKWKMYHCQDCCECVRVEEIVGDLEDIKGSPILQAEVSCSQSPVVEADDYQWTFYKLSTIKGSVTIRWLGTSNGWYSVNVDFEEIEYEQ